MKRQGLCRPEREVQHPWNRRYECRKPTRSNCNGLKRKTARVRPVIKWESCKFSVLNLFAISCFVFESLVICHRSPRNALKDNR